MKSLLLTEGTGVRIAGEGPSYSEADATEYQHLNQANLGVKDLDMTSNSDFNDIDSQTLQYLEAEMEAAIRDAAHSKILCPIMCPPDLLAHISQDILLTSTSEPCGIRGCAIYISLQEKDKCRRLATVICNPLAPPTFEIHLVLKEDNRSWKRLQKVYYTIRGCLLKSHWSAMPILLCSSYKLEKRKLYRRSDSEESYQR